MTLETNRGPRGIGAGYATTVLLFVFALLTVRARAVSATAYFPANNAVNVCADTPLKITFDTVPALGATGTVKIFNATTNVVVDTMDLALNAGNGTQARTIGGTSYNAYPVLVSGNTAAIFPRAGVLAYGATYYVTVDAGVFTGFAGVSGNAAWRFTVKAGAPSTSNTYVTVAADGTGDFCTVQGAVDWVPAANTTRRYGATSTCAMGLIRKSCACRRSTTSRFAGSIGSGRSSATRTTTTSTRARTRAGFSP